MKWYKLKSSKCPKCESALAPEEVNGKIACGNPGCDFSISPEKMSAIVNDQVQKYQRRDRFAAFDRSGWNRF